MKLENQVTSRELSEKMDKLGFEQSSLLWWVHPYQRHSYIVKKNEWIITNNPNDRKKHSAYTVAELGEMLPVTITEDYHEIDFCRGGYSKTFDEVTLNPYSYKEGEFVFDWIVKYAEAYTDKMVHNERADTEANARAKMLIWLKENNYL